MMRPILVRDHFQRLPLVVGQRLAALGEFLSHHTLETWVTSAWPMKRP